VRLAAPAFLALESICALNRRLSSPTFAAAAAAQIANHPALYRQPLDEELLADAQRIGVERRLRGADALYLATAVRLGCPLLSWDAELCSRGGAWSPRAWLERQSGVQQVDGGEQAEHGEDEGQVAGGGQDEAEPGGQAGAAGAAQVAAGDELAGEGADEGAEQDAG
jgi:predicted nucleic acid-binding protein